MPRQGGQGKGKPKLRDRSFGKALIQSTKSYNGSNDIKKREAAKMSSIIENSALEDYVNATEMDGRGVEVRRTHQNDIFLVEPTVSPTLQSLTIDQFEYRHLKIPRKPAWTKEMTAEQVDRQEKDAFLSWRRDLAAMENAAAGRLRITPFEKNIEVWRQLWRVLERSDFAVQVVDARNPLLYFTKDLMTYAAEHSPPRPMILLVNKADFLTDYQRRAWLRYFENVGIKFVFYSAKTEQVKIDDVAHAAAAAASIAVRSIHDDDNEEEDGDDEYEEDDEASDDEDDNVMMREMDILASYLVSADNAHSSPTNSTSNTRSYALGTEASLEVEERTRRRCRTLSRRELIILLSILPRRLGIEPQVRHNGRQCIGMLGYPNVGKSSVINTILGVSKSTHGQVRVAVSATPGKTKHFQTLIVDDELMLCDCPGLVFPSFMRNTGEMLCAGVLPINQMRDFISPAAVIASRVPAHLLDAAYGMRIRREIDIKDNPDRPPTPHEMLCAYCAVKGYITNGTGRWDEFRACKEMLRDFNDGRILFVAPPPKTDSDASLEGPEVAVSGVGSDEDKDSGGLSLSAGGTLVDMAKWLEETEKIMVRQERVAERVAAAKLQEIEDQEEEEDCADDYAEAGGMVFGGLDSRQWAERAGKAKTVVAGVEEDGIFYEFADDSSNSDEDGASASVAITSENGGSDDRREHKRLKHWGKKNKKLRDKNPYGEDNGVVSYAAYSTNRSRIGVVKSDQEKARGRRHDPRNVYGTEFVRVSFPQSGVS